VGVAAAGPDWAQPPAGSSLAERAYYLIRDRILTLAIAPGAAIHEDRLCADLGLGRTPVREAIKRLEAERLVVIYPRRGTFASEINTTDHTLIADVRRQLEAHAAGRAAERATKADVEHLERLKADLARLGGSVLDPDGVPADRHGELTRLMRLDGAIHQAICTAAHNAYLGATLEQYYNLSLRLGYVFIDHLMDVEGHVAGHTALIDAIVTGDVDKARQLAADHVEDFENAVLETEFEGLVTSTPGRDPEGSDPPLPGADG
jgi:DNA-binding GntR family transcriptional regulator